MKLSFLGATGTVTGSKYLVEHEGLKILVDCGLFQGIKEHRRRNWEPLPVNPKEIDALILTHAHIDHSGYIPLLVKGGFRGKIYATQASIDLCSILLPDCGYLQEEEARRANRYGYSKHHPAKPLYSRDDAEGALDSFESLPFGEPHFLSDDFSFSFSRAGHILGSAIVTIKAGKRTLVFSGDLGRPADPMMKPPVFIQNADYLVLESTYGNRLHDKTDPTEKIGEIVRTTLGRGGSVIIPAFAVGRAQSILYHLYRLKQAKQIPAQVPIYLDSPMSIDATEIMQDNARELRLTPEECEGTCKVATYIQTSAESRNLNQNHVPCIILSASGMMTGGRILHHLKEYAPDHRNTILLSGYQAEGTRGARLLNGERELKIHGEMVQVNAQVESLSNTSAHADYEEILSWLGHFRKPPLRVFLTHGSPESAAFLKERIETIYGWPVTIPEYLQKEDLECAEKSLLYT